MPDRRSHRRSFVESVLGQQVHCSFRLGAVPAVQAAAARRLPALLEERPVAVDLLKDYDKGFSCVWLDSRTVAVGTKNDRIICFSSRTLQPRRIIELPLCSERRPDQNPHEIWSQSGIRNLAVNPCGDLLAAAGCGPNDCAVLQLPGCQPLQRLVGHTDWVFGCTWTADRRLVTCGRDRSLRLWDVEVGAGCPPLACKPTAVRTAGQEGKARDVKWCAARQEVASLDVAGCLKLWTGDLTHKADVALVHRRELVCVAEGGVSGLYAVGSVGHVALVDPRTPRVSCVETLDGPRGVRSLQLRNDILSIGTGDGNLFLYDTRASRYLSSPLATSPQPGVRPWHPAPRYAPQPVHPEAGAASLAPPISFAQGDVARPWMGFHSQGQRRLAERPAARRGSGPRGAQPRTARTSASTSGSNSTAGSEAALRTTRAMAGAAAAQAAAVAAAAAEATEAAAARRAEEAAAVAAESDQPPLCLQTGAGWLDRGELYWENIHPDPVPNAIYAHAWDPGGARLFIAGGPLAAGLQGSYMALWR